MKSEIEEKSINELKSELGKYEDNELKKPKRYYDLLSELIDRECNERSPEAIDDAKRLIKECTIKDGKESRSVLDAEAKLLSVKALLGKEVTSDEILELLSRYRSIFGELSEEVVEYELLASKLFLHIGEPFVSAEFLFKGYHGAVELYGPVSKKAIELLGDIIHGLTDFGATSFAISMAEDVLTRVLDNPPHDENMMMLYSILSYVYNEDGKCDIAIEYKKKGVELSMEIFGKGSVEEKEQSLDLASLLISDDDTLEEGGELIAKLLKRTRGFNRVPLMELYAFYYLKTGNVGKAIKIQSKVVDKRGVYKLASDEDMEDYLLAKTILANFYSKKKAYSDAISLQKEIVSEKEKLYGEDTLEYLDSMDLLAGYIAEVNPKEALELCRKIIIARKRFSSDSQGTLSSEYNYAEVLFKAGKIEDALKVVRHLMRIYKRYDEEDFLEAIKAKELLAICYIARGKSGDKSRAIKIYQECLESLLRTQGPDFPLTKFARDTLDDLLEDEGKS